MNSGHDLGGMMGFGPVNPEADEPVFHGEWEERVLAVTLAIGALGQWNLDTSRHARERLPTPVYLTSSYYLIWLKALMTLLEEKGLATASEMTSGAVEQPAKEIGRPILKAENVHKVLGAGGPVERETQTPAAFQPGDQVRAININPVGHTRLPRYVRGHLGEIVGIHGHHVYPDSNGNGAGEDPKWLYSVRFSGAELWGKGYSGNNSVYVDMWEPYLEPA